VPTGSMPCRCRGVIPIWPMPTARDGMATPAYALQKLRFWGGASSVASQGLAHRPPPPGNSAGPLRSPSLHYDLVRVGLALYGHCPASHLRWQASHWSRRMDVCARVTLIREVAHRGRGEKLRAPFPDPAAESLGGGGEWFTPMGCQRRLTSKHADVVLFALAR